MTNFELQPDDRANNSSALSRQDRSHSGAFVPFYEVNGPDANLPTQPGNLAFYVQCLRRRKWIFIAMLIIGVTGGCLFTLAQNPVYQARASIEIQPINENFMDVRDLNPSSVTPSYTPDSELQTQTRILESDFLMQRVASKMNIRYRPDATSSDHLSKQEALLKSTVESLKVKAQPNTRLIEILAESRDRQFAADFANQLAASFMEQYLENRWQSIQNTSDWLKRQMASLKTSLNTSEANVESYARQSGLQLTSGNEDVAQQKLTELERDLAQAEAERIAKQSNYELAATSSPEQLPTGLESSATLKEYQMKLALVRQQIAELTTSLTPENPKVQKLQAQEDSVRESLNKEREDVLTRVRNDYTAARRREELLKNRYASESRVLSDQAGKISHFNDLKRESESTRQLYQAVLQKVNEAGVAAAMRASNVRVVDTARPPALPFRPSTVLNASVGLSMGLLLGFVAVFMKERADHSIREPGESMTYLNTIELAAIPSNQSQPGYRERVHQCAPERAGSGAALSLTGQHPPGASGIYKLPLVSAGDGHSLFAESFRSAATSILYSGRNDGQARVLVLTSVNPGEGKTTVACNLAIMLAQLQRRVLLLDGDVRKPRLHQIFETDNQAGLTSVLEGTDPISIHKTRVPNLSVLPSGPVGRPDLLYSPKLPEVIRSVRKQFDIVLIDAPPVLQISDARVLARFADAVILVVRAKQTTVEAALLARQKFTEDGTSILGTILNDWDPRNTEAYPYATYQKGYEQYYQPSK
jgi:polysaccharide biosynthesis transport protein